MKVRRVKKLGFGLALLASAVAVAAAASPASSSGRALSIGRAEAAARKAVLQHPSYRHITSTRTGLVTRNCRRASGSRVRCRLYAVVPSPCSLEQESDTVCAQVLWERRWLVRVERGRDGRPHAHIVRITSGPSGAD
jgi:hypothetical protein